MRTYQAQLKPMAKFTIDSEIWLLIQFKHLLQVLNFTKLRSIRQNFGTPLRPESLDLIRLM